ncbi:MAG: tRNA (cytidine(34)-2'-O)-methyltransferase, partial [Butyricicoccus pullicaecorum]
GLDYWHFLDIRRYKNVEEFFEKNPNGRYFYLTTKAKHAYTDISFEDGDYFLFGKETRGLPEEMLMEHPERCIRIPMREGARSMNLSNSVAVTVFEALRQTDFAGLEQAGRFPGEMGPAL